MQWTQFWRKTLQRRETIGMQTISQILKIQSTNESGVKMGDATKKKTVTEVDDRNILTQLHLV